jgi:hypothetical protein
LIYQNITVLMMSIIASKIGTRLFIMSPTIALIGQTAVSVVINCEVDGQTEAVALRTGALPATHSPAGVQRDARHIPDIAVPVPQHPVPVHIMPISVMHPTVHVAIPRAPVLKKLQHQLNGRSGIVHKKSTGAQRQPKK